VFNLNKIIRYFDLTSEIRPTAAEMKAEGKEIHWFPQYVFLVLGITIQPFLDAYQATQQWNFIGFWGRVLFAVIIGIIIFPLVYKNTFDPAKPLVVQLFAIVPFGIGWESIFKHIVTASQAVAGK
jgi:hypothetical protein